MTFSKQLRILYSPGLLLTAEQTKANEIKSLCLCRYDNRILCRLEYKYSF